MVGNIEVICGSMFSGKTEELFRRIKRVRIANLKVKLFKPKIDTRYHIENIVSHDANKIEAITIESANEIFNYIDDVQVIGIDEAQFFDEELIDVIEVVVLKGIKIIVAGLDMDYNGKPFGSMPGILCIADEILKLHAVCIECGSTAQFTYRISKDTNQFLLGEKDKYKALCRSCYQNHLSI